LYLAVNLVLDFASFGNGKKNTNNLFYS